MTGFGRKVVEEPYAANDKRLKNRSIVSLPGNLDTTTARNSVTLVDVSNSGAHIQGDKLPDVGLFVRLKVGDSEAFATVVWRREDNCGLKFDARLSDEAVEAFRNTAKEAAELGLDPSDMRAMGEWVADF